MSWTQINSHANNVFEFSTIEPLRKQITEIDLTIYDVKDNSSSGVYLNSRIVRFSLLDLLEALLNASMQRDGQEGYLRLRGQMLYIEEWKAIIYLATPVSVGDLRVEHEDRLALLLAWKISM